MMRVQHPDMQSRLWLEGLALLGIALFFLVFTILNFRYLAVLSDGDIYSDMLVAREMWRQKTLFPSNWVFGNQYYVIATPVIAALFYGITGHMNLSMALATTAMGFLQLLCLAWLIRPVAPRRDHRLCALLLFMAAPMGFAILKQPQGQLFFVLASYYACYTITLFFVLGDYIRSHSDPKRRRPLSLAVSLLLCFATGMQSLRQTCVMILPMLALAAFSILWRLLEKEPLLPKEQWQSNIRMILYTAANLAGCLFIRILHIPSSGIYMKTEQASDSISIRLRALWVALRGISGMDAAQFESPKLFFLLFFLFQILLIVTAALLFLQQLRKKNVGTIGFLWLFCAVSICGVLLAGLLVEINIRNIYLFVWYLWVPLSLLMLLDTQNGNSTQEENRGVGQCDAMQTVRTDFFSGHMGKLICSSLAVVACFLSLGNLIFSYGTSLKAAKETDTSAQMAFLEDAEAAGVKYVYGDWKFAPGYVTLSDGALTGGFWGNTPLYVNEWINLQDIYTEEDNQYALYLVNGWEHDLFLYLVEEKGGNVSFFGEYGFCTAWKADNQLMDLYTP